MENHSSNAKVLPPMTPESLERTGSRKTYICQPAKNLDTTEYYISLLEMYKHLPCYQGDCTRD